MHFSVFLIMYSATFLIMRSFVISFTAIFRINCCNLAVKNNGTAHFFYFIRDIVVPDGVRFFLCGYIRVNTRFDQGIQQIGKAGPGKVGVAIIKIKGNAVLSTELCAVQYLAETIWITSP